ncbi:MAG: hypothetical protein NTU80_04875 [Verrucomicrobia bacterium]|nr:hypothetical protein [Verrucomicrobiota bacterium]
MFSGAVLALGWMLLLPLVAQERFAATTGAQLQVQGLMGDPFSGTATVTAWTLRAGESATAPVLARGGAARAVAPNWSAALDAAPSTRIEIEKLELNVTEARLLPDAAGRWPLLAVCSAAGLPYERGGAVGTASRVRIRHLHLRVETLVVRDAASGRETRVRVDWTGDFADLDHLRPVVTALLDASRTAGRSVAR